MQLGEAEELVEHHFVHGVAPKLDDHPHAVTVGFVAKIGNALDLLVADHFGDLFHHPRLVHLVGDFADDDGLAVAAQRFDLGAPAHDHRTAPAMERAVDAGATVNDAAGREIGAGDAFHELIHGGLRVVEQKTAGIDDFAEIMGRNIGGHADGDAAGAVD